MHSSDQREQMAEARYRGGKHRRRYAAPHELPEVPEGLEPLEKARRVLAMALGEAQRLETSAAKVTALRGVASEYLKLHEAERKRDLEIEVERLQAVVFGRQS